MTDVQTTTVGSTNRLIEVRKATAVDYEAVMNINRNVYQGVDYLPNQYHSLVEDPDFHYYVCTVDGEVAAFEGVCKLDDGKTLLMRSLRVKDKFQGQGLSSYIRKQIYEDFDHFNQTRVRLSCSEQNRFTTSPTFLNRHRLLKKEKRVTFHEVDLRRMAALTTKIKQAQPISWEEFDHMLQSNKVKNCLYPDNIMTQDFWCYDAIPSNIRHLKKRCQRIFVTGGLYAFLPEHNSSIISLDPTVNTKTPENSRNSPCSQNGIDGCFSGKSQDVEVKGLLGIVSSYFSPDYFYMVVNTAGQPREETQKMEFASIIEQSIIYAQSVYAENVEEKRKFRLAIVCNQVLQDELFHNIAKPLGFEPARDVDDVKAQFYFEQSSDSLVPGVKTACRDRDTGGRPGIPHPHL